jgi:hypothetical protein
VEGIWWDIGLLGGSSEPHYQDHEQELLHDHRPKESAPKADADADQPGVTDRTSEMAGD